MTVRFDSVRTVMRRLMAPVPFPVRTDYTSAWTPGHLEVLQQGATGVAQTAISSRIVNGRVVSSTILQRTVVVPPVAERRRSAPWSMYDGTLTEPGTGATTQRGEASWYDPPWSGLTAAHPWLPFGTLVTVTDRATGRSVTVVIDDRGPFGPGRIIDLSPEAFAQLRPDRPGVLDVELDWYTSMRAGGGTRDPTIEVARSELPAGCEPGRSDRPRRRCRSRCRRRGHRRRARIAHHGARRCRRRPCAGDRVRPGVVAGARRGGRGPPHGRDPARRRHEAGLGRDARRRQLGVLREPSVQRRYLDRARRARGRPVGDADRGDAAARGRRSAGRHARTARGLWRRQPARRLPSQLGGCSDGPAGGVLATPNCGLRPSCDSTGCPGRPSTSTRPSCGPSSTPPSRNAARRCATRCAGGLSAAAADGALATAGVDPTARPETLDLAAFARVTEAVHHDRGTRTRSSTCSCGSSADATTVTTTSRP
jgi:rare lipoprotein A